MSRQGPRDQEVTNGAAHVTIKDSLVEIETTGSGEKIDNLTSSVQSNAYTATMLDISTAGSTGEVFIAIGSNPTAVAHASYHIAAGTTYRFKITSGNKVAVISTVADGDTWIHPVA